MSAPPYVIPRRSTLPNAPGRADLIALARANANRGNNHACYNHLEIAMSLTIHRRRRSLGPFLWRLVAHIMMRTGLARFNQQTASPICEA